MGEKGASAAVVLDLMLPPRAALSRGARAVRLLDGRRMQAEQQVVAVTSNAAIVRVGRPRGSKSHKHRREYSDAMVARVKAAQAVGFTVKGISHFTGIPYTLVREWVTGKRRMEVAADPEFARALYMLIVGGVDKPSRIAYLMSRCT